MLSHAAFDLRDGQALVWNYDGDCFGSSCTMDDADREEQLALGHGVVPCACRVPGPCPRARWLRRFASA